MNLDWILSPFTCYAVVALALVASIACFVSTKAEVYRLRRTANASQDVLKRKMEEMQSAVAAISQASSEPAVAAPARPLSLRPGLNLTRRTQALRMRRRGESAESIAAALSAPRNEIELLLKIYEVTEYRRQLKAPAQP
jgi:hypothetical protein